MKEFTTIFVIACELLAEGFFIWLLIQCKSVFTGFMSTWTSVAVSFAIYRYSFYIALAVVWGVRFAAVFGIVAFVLGFYPKPQKAGT